MSAWLPLPPYAEFLGIRHDPTEIDSARIMLPGDSSVEGRRGFIHGGVIGGLLEMACYNVLLQRLGADDRPRIKPINVAIDFLRGGLMRETYASARILRIGKRIANAHATAWQGDPDKPIATARMHFLLDRDERDAA